MTAEMPFAGRGRGDGGGIAPASAHALPGCVATCAMAEVAGVRMGTAFACVRLGKKRGVHEADAGAVVECSSPPPHRFSLSRLPSECQSGELKGTEPRRMAGTPPGVVSREAEERDLMGC